MKQFCYFFNGLIYGLGSATLAAIIATLLISLIGCEAHTRFESRPTPAKVWSKEHSIIVKPQLAPEPVSLVDPQITVFDLEEGTITYDIGELALEPIPAETEDTPITPEAIAQAIPQECRDYTSQFEGKQVAWEVEGGELGFLTFKVGDSDITVSVQHALPELYEVIKAKKFILTGTISSVSEYSGDINFFYPDVVLEEVEK